MSDHTDTPGKKPNNHSKKTESGDMMARLRSHADVVAGRLEEARQVYKKMLEEAEIVYQQNEIAFKNIRGIRHEMMGARTLSGLLELLIEELMKLDVGQVIIALDKDIISPDAASITALPNDVLRRLLFIERTALSPLMNAGDEPAPLIGEACKVDKLSLFGPDIKSCVLLPLKHRDVIGYLNLGSSSETKFAEDRSPDLLEDLAVTAAMCIDNVITHQRNEELATTDALTGIHNRRYFYECSAKTIDLANRYGDSVSCIYIDLNDFKPINDNYGHDVGDLALKKLVYAVQARIRKTDVFARVGGDEFALLLPRVNFEQASMLAEELRETVKTISFAEDGYDDLKMSASFGVASTRSRETSLESLMSRADEAMYRDKGEKRRR